MNNDWNSNEQSSKKTVIFVLIIIILIMIIAILGLVLFKLLKEDKPAQTAESSVITTIAETTQITTETTTTTAETTSQKPTTEKVTTTKETTTVKVTAAKASIKASLVEEPALQGVTVYLVVSGDYSSYSYTRYAYDAGGSDPYTTNGTSSSGKLEVYAFSGGVSKIVVDVTPFNSEGIAGDTVRATYVPSFAGGTPTPSKTSCNRNGTIYSPSGNKVDGLTKSYLINGGSASYERHDLTHGWHVTAVSQYFDGTIYWYELYDTDDGDYYGWVASYNISFY